jgi:hypothetical protein
MSKAYPQPDDVELGACDAVWREPWHGPLGLACRARGRRSPEAPDGPPKKHGHGPQPGRHTARLAVAELHPKSIGASHHFSSVRTCGWGLVPYRTGCQPPLVMLNN